MVELDGESLADAPVEVVATKREVRNRAPNAITAELRPVRPAARDVVQCRVATSLVTEDPDFDIVRYRYRWTVDGKLVRAVQTAALRRAPEGPRRPGKDRPLLGHAERR